MVTGLSGSRSLIGYLDKGEFTLAGGQKIAWVYRQNSTGRVTLQPRTT